MGVAAPAKSLVRNLLPSRLSYAISMRRAHDPLIDVIRPHVKNKLFIDVGANTGVFSYYLGRDAERVIAFEPFPETAVQLQTFNRAIDVQICALSNTTGTSTFYVPTKNNRAILTRCSLNQDANPGYELTAIDVAVKRLDDFEFSNVGGIKIDVEGHEWDVIRGAVDTLARNKPCLVIEVEERHHKDQSTHILEWVEALGYRSFYYQDGLRSARGFDFRNQYKRSLDGSYETRLPNYINNFFFQPL